MCSFVIGWFYSVSIWKPIRVYDFLRLLRKKTAFAMFSENAAPPGFGYITQRNPIPKRIFWFLVLVGGLIYPTYNFQKQFRKYRRYNRNQNLIIRLYSGEVWACFQFSIFNQTSCWESIARNIIPKSNFMRKWNSFNVTHQGKISLVTTGGRRKDLWTTGQHRRTQR